MLFELDAADAPIRRAKQFERIPNEALVSEIMAGRETRRFHFANCANTIVFPAASRMNVSVAP